MAFSNTYDTTSPGSAVGNREDLSSVLTILAPEETPLLSLASKKKATATFHEWTADTLATPNADGVSEGADVTSFDDKFANRARLGNYVQKFRRPYLVSDLQQATTSVGPADIAQAQAKSMRELKRDIEFALASDNDRSAEDGAGTPYKLRGLGDWLDSAGPADVPADYRTPAASIDANGASITEAQFNAVISSIFTVNGEVNNLNLIAGTALRSAVSDFTRADTSSNDTTYTVTQSAESKKITLAVDVYESDFGYVKILNGNPACMPASDRGYVLNTQYYGVAELIPMGNTRLEDQGGGERGYCDSTLTLCVNHPGAHGKIS